MDVPVRRQTRLVVGLAVAAVASFALLAAVVATAGDDAPVRVRPSVEGARGEAPNADGDLVSSRTTADGVTVEVRRGPLPRARLQSEMIWPSVLEGAPGCRPVARLTVTTTAADGTAEVGRYHEGDDRAVHTIASVQPFDATAARFGVIVVTGLSDGDAVAATFPHGVTDRAAARDGVAVLAVDDAGWPIADTMPVTLERGGATSPLAIDRSPSIEVPGIIGLLGRSPACEPGRMPPADTDPATLAEFTAAVRASVDEALAGDLGGLDLSSAVPELADTPERVGEIVVDTLRRARASTYGEFVDLVEPSVTEVRTIDADRVVLRIALFDGMSRPPGEVVMHRVGGRWKLDVAAACQALANTNEYCRPDP